MNKTECARQALFYLLQVQREGEYGYYFSDLIELFGVFSLSLFRKVCRKEGYKLVSYYETDFYLVVSVHSFRRDPAVPFS